MTMTYSADLTQDQNSTTAALSRAMKRIPLAARIFLAVALLLALWGLVIATFGYPALILPLTVVVPSFYVLLVIITWA